MDGILSLPYMAVSFKKSEPSEVIEKGELVVINPEDNRITVCSEEESKFVIGVAEKGSTKQSNITYYLGGLDEEQTINQSLSVIIGGLATVKVSGHVNIGDLLISSEEPGKAKAVRYPEDRFNVGKVIGKVIQYTNNDDEVLAIINFS